MKFRPKIEKIIKKNKIMSSVHNFVDFDDENQTLPVNLINLIKKGQMKLIPKLKLLLTYYVHM